MSTLVGLLRDRATARPGDVPYVFLDDGEDDARSITAAELDARARAIACGLLDAARPGERALLVVPPGLDYVAAFFGCLYAGVIAVPAYPPDPRRLARTVPRLMAIVHGAGAGVVVTTRAIRAMSAVLAPHAPGLDQLRWVAIDDAGDGSAWRPPAIDTGTIALLQFTSGSTAAPRGVILTHGCVMANLAAIHVAFGLADRPPRTVSWLPPYHDMGLVGGILASLYSGGSAILMSPLHFLQRPARWLRAITTHRADVSGGPNFAYDLCVRKIDPTQEPLDLSTWQVAFNGAEVVRADTLERFAARFAPVGFRRTAWLPCYGLAEATLIATAVPRADEPTVIHVDRDALERGCVVPSPGGVAQVSSGRPPEGVELAIVDPATGREVPEGRIAEVWLAGGSVGAGYWELADDTERTFGARIRPDDDRSIAGPREARIGDSSGGGSPMRGPDDDRSIAGPREARIGDSSGGGSPMRGPDDDRSIAGPREARIGDSSGGGSPMRGPDDDRSIAGPREARLGDSSGGGSPMQGPGGRGPFLRTGDLGFVLAGELFVTGRIKDLIIVHGRKLFPDDLERVAATAHPSLRAGGTAAFGAELDGREQLVIAQEVDPEARGHGELRDAIRRAIVLSFDIAPREIVLLAAGALPKTSSGKIQRHACRRAFAEGALHDVRCAASNEIVG